MSKGASFGLFNMKTAIVCLLVTIFAVVNSARIARDEKYTDKYDNVDIKHILSNDRLLQGYFKCLKDGEGCNADGKELSQNIPDALTNDCSKCTDVQKEKAEEVLKFLYENKQEYMKQLEEKFDTNGVYRKRYYAKYGDKLKPGTLPAEA